MLELAVFLVAILGAPLSLAVIGGVACDRVANARKIDMNSYRRLMANLK